MRTETQNLRLKGLSHLNKSFLHSSDTDRWWWPGTTDR